MDYYNYDYMDQDMWWRENPGQNHYTNDSHDIECYDSGYYNDDSYEPCGNDWGWTDDSAQNPYYESPYFSETQESLDESSDNNKWDQMRDMQEDNSKRLLTIQKKLDELMERLNQPPPPGNLSDTTQVQEVSLLSSVDLFDNKVYEPTPPEVEIVVEDYVSLDDNDRESFFEIKEVVTDLENCNENLHDLETPQVGEGSVEANTTPDPMNLKEHENQPLVVMESKRPIVFKQPNVIIDRPLLASIYTQNSCRDSTIDVIFGNQKVRLLLFEPTDDPPISGDLVVINTVDDNVYEHTPNMLTDTTRTLENCLPCFRSKALVFRVSQKVKKKFPNKKHDASLAHKSKMKVFYGIKSRIKHSRGRHKARRLGFYKVNENMTFDPGGSRLTYDPP